MSNVYRNFKDNVFCLLYSDKKNLLELYNAVNGTAYDNVEMLEVVTLPNAICMKYKNDAAYTLDRHLFLNEQQSTKNPNIPLRLLHYVSEEYKNMVEPRQIYGRTPVSIPTPHFIVFYNGTEPQPERQVLKLSDLYAGNGKGADTGTSAGAGIFAGTEPELELSVTVLNINSGNNEKLLARCNTLREYMIFVDKVRYKRQYMDIESAVKEAVDECIREGILKDFFEKHMEEVIDVSIFEYDEELARQAAVEDGRIIGIELGRKQGMELGREEGREEGRVEGRVEGRLMQLFELVDDGTLTVETAAKKAGMTVDEFMQKKEEAVTLA